jgi:gamma-glutamyltranspeptidase/glutathione hydrolase
LKKTTVVEDHGTPPAKDSDFFEQLNKHTTHIATADAEGNWVAITTTINTSYGSKVVIPGTGVVMNNQMDDFSAKEGVPNAFNLVGAFANSVQPGKRPLSSMSPTIVMKNNQPVMTVGAAGGPTIINQVVQAIVNHLVLGMSLEDAIAQYRIHHQWTPDRMIAEGAMPEEVKQALEVLGNEVQTWERFGATQAIAQKNGKFVAVSEPRIQL